MLFPTRCSPVIDRKSTRLYSSHPSISYAVFCLKKKKGGLRGGRSPPRGPRKQGRETRCAARLRASALVERTLLRCARPHRIRRVRGGGGGREPGGGTPARETAARLRR